MPGGRRSQQGFREKRAPTRRSPPQSCPKRPSSYPGGDTAKLPEAGKAGLLGAELRKLNSVVIEQILYILQQRCHLNGHCIVSVIQSKAVNISMSREFLLTKQKEIQKRCDSPLWRLSIPCKLFDQIGQTTTENN